MSSSSFFVRSTGVTGASLLLILGVGFFVPVAVVGVAVLLNWGR